MIAKLFYFTNNITKLKEFVLIKIFLKQLGGCYANTISSSHGNSTTKVKKEKSSEIVSYHFSSINV